MSAAPRSFLCYSFFDDIETLVNGFLVALFAVISLSSCRIQPIVICARKNTFHSLASRSNEFDIHHTKLFISIFFRCRKIFSIFNKFYWEFEFFQIKFISLAAMRLINRYLLSWVKICEFSRIEITHYNMWGMGIWSSPCILCICFCIELWSLSFAKLSYQKPVGIQTHVRIYFSLLFILFFDFFYSKCHFLQYKNLLTRLILFICEYCLTFKVLALLTEYYLIISAIQCPKP